MSAASWLAVCIGAVCLCLLLWWCLPIMVASLGKRLWLPCAYRPQNPLPESAWRSQLTESVHVQYDWCDTLDHRAKLHYCILRRAGTSADADDSSRSSKPTVRACFYTHGNDGDLSRWLYAVTAGTGLYSYFDVMVLWDYRGYGLSLGQTWQCLSDGISDAQQVWCHALHTHLGKAAVRQWDWVLYGRSLGGWMATRLYNQALLPVKRCRRLLLEVPCCVLLDSAAQACTRLGLHDWKRVHAWSLPLRPSQRHWAHHLPTVEQRPLVSSHQQQGPDVWIIGCTNDELVPYSNLQDWANREPHRVRLTSVEDANADHNSVSQTSTYQPWVAQALTFVPHPVRHGWLEPDALCS